MRLLLLLSVFAVGCAPKGLRMPGPLGALGTEVVPPPGLPEPVVAEVEPEPEPEPDPLDATHPKARETEHGRAVAAAAAHYLTHKPPGRDDCSGFVCAVYTRAGAPLSGNTRSLWDLAKEHGATHKRKIPSIGDLVFFDNTYDRDRDGKRNDELTHVAVVMEVLGDGTVIMAHAGTSKGRVELRMNLLQPEVLEDEAGSVLNDYLRARYRTDPEGTPRLAGQLFRGFATLDPEQLDAWASAQ
ncbi:MAG: CHAP domain-containing protein [Deltaproteobacteria bacterium]|nr:MAG: CHAP domain-containing protein [Deltaproteobacteria bacterium]